MLSPAGTSVNSTLLCGGHRLRHVQVERDLGRRRVGDQHIASADIAVALPGVGRALAASSVRRSASWPDPCSRRATTRSTLEVVDQRKDLVRRRLDRGAALEPRTGPASSAARIRTTAMPTTRTATTIRAMVLIMQCPSCLGTAAAVPMPQGRTARLQDDTAATFFLAQA